MSNRLLLTSEYNFVSGYNILLSTILEESVKKNVIVIPKYYNKPSEKFKSYFDNIPNRNGTEKELLLFPSFNYPDIQHPLLHILNGKNKSYFSMWESSRIGDFYIDKINLFDRIIVPNKWNKETFENQGCTSEISVVNLGIDTNVFNYTEPNNNDIFTFGTGNDDPRKRLPEVIKCFIKAFPNEKDVRLSIKISKLFGPNGELLENNILQIAAEISPKFNLSDIITLAQQQVEEGNFISKLFGIEENQVRENVANNINEILKGANENIAASMDVLTTQYEDGEISFTKYQEGIKQQTDLINKNTTKAIDSFAQYLGKTDAELKNLYDRNKFGNLRTQESKAVVKFFDDQRKAAEQSLVGVGQGFESSIVDAVFTGLADGDVLKATEYFNQLTTGNIDKDLVDKIVKALTDKGLIEAANAFRNYITPQVTSRAPDGVKPPVTFQEEDPPGSGGEKSKIQILEESIKQTKEYSAALSVLVKRGLSPEAAANLDAATAIELVKKKRLDLVKAVNQQAAAQRVLQNIVKGEDERQVDILEAQTDAIDANIEAVQDQIDAINKLNDADQRQLTVRNKALEDLSKKEENVNKSYNARIDALNRVKEANAQVAQQEKNRLDLASALTSGDIAAAAQAALTMTEDFAQGQIDNTQAELELQRQREIDALTTSVNGQLLTRQQIESQIDSINQRMYERDLQTWPLQDQIKNLESQREVIARQIEATQLRIRARQIEEEARVGRLVGYYKDIAKYINQAANRKYDPTAANAGGVIKKAFGGFLKYTSNEPAPGMAMGGKMKKYAVGNIVPGLGNTDRVPALLTPGEFVVRKSVAAENMDMLKALNGDVFPSIKGTGSSVELGSVAPTTSTINNTPVYTYNVNVNVPNTDASPEEIANVVVGKLRRMTDTNLRSNRL